MPGRSPQVGPHRPSWARPVPPCVGRNAELRSFVEALQDVENGHGSCWLITGPAGIGKSRLLTRLGELASQRSLGVAAGYAIDGALRPLQALQPLLAAYGDAPGEATPSDHYGAPRRIPGARATEGRRAIAEGGRTRKYASASRSGPGSAEPSLLALLEGLQRACDRRPQTLLLDDLQFADAESRRAVRLLVAATRTLPVVLAITARVGPEDRDQGPVGRELLALRREPGVRSLDLGPLDEDARVELVSHLAGGGPDERRLREQLRALVRWLGGTPYFLVEYVSSARHRAEAVPGGRFSVTDLLARGAGPEGTSGAVPPAIRTTILARLERLPARDQRLIHVAALLGPEFDAEPLAAALGLPQARTSAALRRLSGDGWPFRATASAPDRFAFEHTLLWSTVNEATSTAGDRVALGRLVRWWSSHAPDDPTSEARFRALLHDTRGAWGCLERAVDAALRSGALRSVPELVRWGRTELPPGRLSERRLETLVVGAGRQLLARWEFDRLQDLLRELPPAGLSPRIAWQARLWAYDCEIAQNPGPSVLPRDDLDRLAVQAFPSGDAEPRRMLAYARALEGWRGSSPRAAHRAIATALRQLNDGRHDPYRFRLRVLDTFLLSNEGRFAQARRQLRALRSSAKWAAGSAPTRLFDGLSVHVAFRSGHFRSAIALGRQHVGECRRAGDLGREAAGLLQLAACEFALRDLSRVHADLDRAETIFRGLQLPRLLSALALLRAWTFGLEQRWSKSEAGFRDLRATRRSAEPPSRTSWVASVGYAWALAERGEVDAGRRALPSFEPEAERSPAYLTECCCAAARVLELAGDLSGAQAMLERAVRSSTAVGGATTDQLEAYLQMARWARAHGNSRTAARWLGRVNRLGLLTDAERRAWVGIGFSGESVPSAADRLTAQPGPTQEYSVESLGGSILSYLQRPLGRSSASSGAPGVGGWTERELADGLGVERSRFSRALGRLRAAGLVERESIRRPDGQRSVYAYRLATPPRASPTG